MKIRVARCSHDMRKHIPIILFIAAMIVARASLADHYIVPTESMEPTVHAGDRLVVNKAAFGIRLPLTQIYLLRYDDPSPGDVVVLDSPEDDKVLLKRVVATPDSGPLSLQEDGFLVMGDNRDNSHDGRNFGLVGRDTILGRAVGVYFSECNFVWWDL